MLSRAGVTAIVVAKLSLILGALVVLSLGASHLGTGIGLAVVHGAVAAGLLALLFWGSIRHRDLVGAAQGQAHDRRIGIVLHRAAGYDLLARILTFVREGRFRDTMLRLAKLQPGESMLDVACGTGTLAIAAKRKLGLQGRVEVSTHRPK